MNLKVHRKGKFLSTKEAKYVTNFWLGILLGERLKKNITLDLWFDMIAECGDVGTCSPRDHDNPNGCREFDVVVETDLPREEALRVLAHELEHVRQFARNEIVNDHRKLFYWRPHGAYYQMTEKNHKKLPWEIQAYRTENWLLHFYQEHCKKHDLKF